MIATTLSATIADLCAAIDAGDEAVLPILADALEEAGDPRAEGLRAAAALHKPEQDPYWGFQWWCSEGQFNGDAEVSPPIMDSMKASLAYPHWSGTAGMFATFVYFTTRSAAYLALAAALIAEPANAAD